MQYEKLPFMNNSNNNFPLQISLLSEEGLLSATELFNACAESELPYKKMNPSAWKELFFCGTSSVENFSFQATVDNRLVGFSSGCYNPNTGNCYVTFILVDKNYRRRGIGRMLLETLEHALKNRMLSDNPSGGKVKLQITFFNPCTLTWLIPNTPGHDHPNAPGVDITSDAFSFFKSGGYEPFVYQNSFYLPLEEYIEPPFIAEKKKALLPLGISLEYYDSSKHHGLAELCDDLKNPVWKEELLANDALGTEGFPLVAAIRDNKILAFTGPLRVQDSGRGYFAGIGVHSNCRGLGLGNVLFHTLCATLKEMGAEFMTLFTGESNPAGQIYQQAGFKIVKTWADMEHLL